MTIRPSTDDDRPWLDGLFGKPWSEVAFVSRGRLLQAADLDVTVATTEAGVRGLVGVRTEADSCEVVVLHADTPRLGLGRRLLEHARGRAFAGGSRRLWLVTTNANTNAQGFYEHLGMRRVAIHEGAIDAARTWRPTIPTHDEAGTPLRDEVEYEWKT